MKPLISIDPGASGGIAWIENDQIFCCKMPEGMTSQADFIKSITSAKGCKDMTAIIERVGTYMPGNSGPAAVTFARHCGHLEAILYMCGISTEQVLPNKWMKSIMGEVPKDKKERKNKIKELMARKYPHLKVTLSTSDALGILTWGLVNVKT